MELFPLTARDKTIFEGFLKRREHQLSSYAFENILMWRSLFEVRWAVIHDRLCIFFYNNAGCFMYLPPLGGFDEAVLEAVFKIMDEHNHNCYVSRIENIEEDDVLFFQERDYRIFEKGREYVVDQRRIASLKGGAFKAKRALYNFFRKNHAFVFRDYAQEDREQTLELYRRWMLERRFKNSDPIYQAMLEDSFKAFRVWLERLGEFQVSAKVVECGGDLKAFTSGYPLTLEMFCINFEVADISVKGLSQFIFSEFAKALEAYSELNIMDDSEIESLRWTKFSYRPLRLIRSMTARKG
jgi:hypothetical protein